MPSRTHNAKAGSAQMGSGGDNPRQQKQQQEHPQKSNARDREGRKGGDNAKKL